MPRYREYGQAFRLYQAALELRVFTVSELMSLTGIGANTVYSFVSRFDESHLQSQDLPSSGLGRPRKRYCLTEEGATMFAEANSKILGAMRKLRADPKHTLEQLLQEILKLSVVERMTLLQQIQHSLDQPAAAAATTARYESATSNP